MTKDNEVFGYIKISKPTVTYYGNVKGRDGISWSYILMCPYGNISNTLFGAASHYFQIMMEQKELRSEEGGFLNLL